MDGLYQQLKQFGHVKINEPLSKYTTFKIGGPADWFVIVEETEKLVELLRFLDSDGTPYFILGGGSNMLVRDEGFQGVVVQISNRKLEIINQNIVIAESGCVTVDIAQRSIQANLTGFEWGVGIPGTIGGAVRGNAGAMDGEIKDVVEKVGVYRDGEVVALTNTECEFDYRDSIFKHNHDVILQVWLRFEKTASKEGIKKALENLQYRNKTQPQGYASTGCIFKNKELKILNSKLINEFRNKYLLDDERVEKFFEIGKISAGWLVEQSGMKGIQVGQAKVSERHGNFIVNLGGATAMDVLTLVEQIKEKVYNTCGIEIEEEIQIV